MDDGLKKRLLGATVLVSLAVIFVPMLFEKEPADDSGMNESKIPLPPEDRFSSSILPLENEDLSTPPAQITPLKQLGEESGPSSNDSGKILELKPEKRSEIVSPVESVALDTTQETNPPEQEERLSKLAIPTGSQIRVPSWVVQVGSFSNRVNADKIANELKKKGYPTFIEQADINGNTVFRVRVGPEKNKPKAKQMLAQLDLDLATHKLKGSLKRYP